MTEMNNTFESLESMKKMTKDVRVAAATLGREEARYLVDTYYQMQEFRKATANQVRSIGEGEPNETIKFFNDNFATLERQIKGALQRYAEAQPIGKWMLSIYGIGPVISAGIIANIDISKVQTAGQIQAFCGLDPTKTWEKGKRRPWNGMLKALCWNIGECFVKVSNKDADVYGKIYKARKEYEIAKNEAGDYADQAKAKLERFNIGKNTDAYKYYSEGKLPPAHINERAKRYAVKIFLSHLFEVWYTIENGEQPPKPYAIAILNHAHKIEPPNFDGQNIIL